MDYEGVIEAPFNTIIIKYFCSLHEYHVPTIPAQSTQ